MQTRYPSTIREEELKNKVAADFFGAFDCSRILGNVDFCAQVPATDLPLCDAESVVWAEAKRGADAPLDFALVQLVLTVGKERTFDRHLPPKFLAAFNAARIAFIPYSEVVETFYQNDFNWNVAPSDHETREFGVLYQRVVRTLESAALEFDFAQDEAELRGFIKANLVAGRAAPGSPHTVQITKNNFTHIYQRWREAVMPTILMPDWAAAKKNGIIDADFFLADIFSSDNAAVTDRLNVLLMNDHYRQARGIDALGFQLFSEIAFSDGQKAHRVFWNRYRRPPRREYWNYIVNRRDLLVPQDVRERKGSFFTPQKWVSLSQDYLAAALGPDWQDDHYVWDCCAGTGNLEVGLTNKYNVWVSTLDQADVDVIHQRIGLGANLLDSHVFQFDFLNDSFDKLPQGLRDIINDPEKRRRLVVYINPPYAEGDSRKGEGRSGVAAGTMVAEKYGAKMGYGKRELFIQFLMRIHEEISGCVIGQFSTQKHLQGPKQFVFRSFFHASLKASFLVPADTFDNVKGEFPIGFFVWRLRSDDASSSYGRIALVATGDGGGAVTTQPFASAVADVYDRNGVALGQKTLFSYDGLKVINDWIVQFASNDYSDRSMGTILAVANDFQHRNTVNLCEPNKQWNHQFQWQVLPENLIPSAVYFATRLCMEHEVFNHYDQFLWPDDGWENDTEFQADCLIFMLFHGKNFIKSADGVNHWIPFTEEEVGAKDCFASHFMSDWLAGRRYVENNAPCQGELDLAGGVGTDGTNETGGTRASSHASRLSHSSLLSHLSHEARAVLDAGRALWRYYHSQPDANPNASYYDIRLHFQGVKRTASGKEQMNAASGDETYNSLLAALRSAHKALAAKIAPKVYEYGFLRR